MEIKKQKDQVFWVANRETGLYLRRTCQLICVEKVNLEAFSVLYYPPKLRIRLDLAKAIRPKSRKSHF